MRQVYLAKMGEFYKIGYSNDPQRRVKELIPTKFPIPYKVKLVHAVERESAPQLEQYLHRQYSLVRVNGEWFQLSPEQVDAVKQFMDTGQLPPPKSASITVSSQELREVMSYFAKLSNRVLTDAQREARRKNAAIARKVKAAKHNPTDNSK